MSREEAKRELLRDAAVSGMLDKVITIDNHDPAEFSEKLAPFVQPTESFADDGEPERQRWPLVTHVRIHIRAAPLRLGAVLVDLPGLADANASREAVTQAYLQKAGAVVSFSAPTSRSG